MSRKGNRGKQKIRDTGRAVLFVGGPEAGNIRRIPDSAGDKVQAEGDYVYWIHPIKFNKQVMYFAFDAQRDPMNLFAEMWREYSEAAQIRRGVDNRSYSKVKPQ